MSTGYHSPVQLIGRLITVIPKKILLKNDDVNEISAISSLNCQGITSEFIVILCTRLNEW